MKWASHYYLMLRGLNVYTVWICLSMVTGYDTESIVHAANILFRRQQKVILFYMPICQM